MDAFLLARLVCELDEEWRGSWVQEAWQDEDGRLILQLRRSGPASATRFLLLSPAPGAQGLGTVAERPPVPPRPPALAAYLRAHVTGGRLAFARCPPFERVVEFGIERQEGAFRVVLEATGRRGNVLILDAGGDVRSAWRWEPSESHPLRPLEPGRTYEPPPKPAGLVSPDRVTREGWEGWLAAGTPLHRAVAGLGPVLAREAAERGWEGFRSLVDDYGS
ncbi:MAG: NFACT family protein, partial [Deltaproteobacteria bacterium]|nr:NFACT family protein [Deltaproteobacteria bacterium]